MSEATCRVAMYPMHYRAASTMQLIGYGHYDTTEY